MRNFFTLGLFLLTIDEFGPLQASIAGPFHQLYRVPLLQTPSRQPSIGINFVRQSPTNGVRQLLRPLALPQYDFESFRGG